MFYSSSFLAPTMSRYGSELAWFSPLTGDAEGNAKRSKSHRAWRASRSFYLPELAYSSTV